MRARGYTPTGPRSGAAGAGTSMLALVTLFIVVLLSLLVTRVAAVALTLTGMSREAARFQARSAFTGVGFTTSEAELVVKHPVRRRIVMALMLLGNIGIASVIATLILSFAAGGSGELRRGLVLLAGVAVLWLAASSQWIGRHLERLIARVLRRWTDLPRRDYGSLLHVREDYGISELRVGPEDWLAGRTLAQTRPGDEGMVVLGIERGDAYLGAPSGSTEVCADDTLLLYGPVGRVKELDRRLRGRSGDAKHAEAVEERSRRTEAEERAAAEAASDGA